MGWEPPVPLILGAWWFTYDWQKRARFKLHLQWAEQRGCLDVVAAFLDTLRPNDWHTIARSRWKRSESLSPGLPLPSSRRS
jgi:hypothetical protein